MAEKNDLSVLRHSAAHLAAHAITELYPGVKLTIGPATEDGFFYDILPVKNLKEEDLAIIEKRMLELAEKNYPLTHREISKAEGREIFKDNQFKLELIDQIPGETLGFAQQGDFYDLCRGGHVASTGEIKNVKLTGLSGSYWRGDRDGQALQRIHGTAFFTAEDLAKHLKHQEDLQMYDHRRLGKQLDYFSFQDEAVGFPFFHPKGKAVLNVLVEYMRKLHREYSYTEVSTPVLLSAELWHRSGHYAHYKDNMYFTQVDDASYAIKPMNCPGSFLIYNNRPRSYRELPLKLAEFGHVHRHELSGVLHGLLRVRAFTQDDSHTFCTIDQVEKEILSILDLAFRVLKKCEFSEIQLALSTRPDNAMGSTVVWDMAIQAIENALKKYGHPYRIKEGEGAFYGPKIEIVIKDAMGREWQCGTAQVDFLQPENFDMTYVTSQGTHERPVVIHAAIYGSLERFFAILLEHFKGHLPLWLAPVQMKILTITDAQREYGAGVMEALKKRGFRVELDHTSDQISAKIKTAQLEKIPWMIVIGGKEADQGLVSVRYADGKQQMGITLDALIEQAEKLAQL